MKKVAIVSLLLMTIVSSTYNSQVTQAKSQSEVAQASSFSKHDLIDYNTVQNNVKRSYIKQLKNVYDKNNIDLSSPNVKREVIVNKVNDIECIKESFTKPVIIYEENISSKSYQKLGDDGANFKTSSTQSTTYSDNDINIVQYVNWGKTITITTGISMDCIPTPDIMSEPMKIKKVWSDWETDDKAGDGQGAGVDKINCRVAQYGKPYNGGTTQPIDEYFTEQQDELAAYDGFNKYYNISTYTEIPEYSPTGGAAGYYATYDIRFEIPSVPYKPPYVEHYTFDRKVGFGALPS